MIIQLQVLKTSAVNPESTWGQLGVNSGSTWGQHGVNLGSTRGQPGGNLHRPTWHAHDGGDGAQVNLHLPGPRAGRFPAGAGAFPVHLRCAGGAVQVDPRLTLGLPRVYPMLTPG